MKIIFAGWWTWWHIFPSLAILNSLNNLKKQNKNNKIKELFIISKNNLDEEILNNNLNSRTNFKYQKISSWKLRRYFGFFAILENFLDIFKFIFGFFQSLKIILKFKPDLIFCKWWFVSLPVALAWRVLDKKIVLHESDSVMWITNKIIAKFCIWKKWKIFYWEKIWNPINFNWKIFWEVEKNIFLKNKNLLEKIWDKKILFVSWGSQWAEEINNLIKDNLEKICEIFFIIHLTGIWKSLNIKNKNYLSFEFLSSDDYFNFLQISDLVISRAWAWSIAEILFFQKASILIPLIWSAWEHQMKNAKKLENNNLAKIFINDWKILLNYEKFLKLLKFDFSKIKNNLKQKNFQNPAKIIAENLEKLIIKK